MREDDDQALSNEAEIRLTEREMQIARTAARLAVKEMTDNFYKQVGRGVVTRLLVWVGLVVVGVAAGKGWIKFP